MALKSFYVGGQLVTVDDAERYPDGSGYNMHAIKTALQLLVMQSPTQNYHVLRVADLPPFNFKTLFVPVVDAVSPVELLDYTGTDAGMIWAVQRVDDDEEGSVDRWTLYVWDAQISAATNAPYRMKPSETADGAWLALAGWYKLGNITTEGNLFPATDDAYYVGSETYRWKGFFSSLSASAAPVSASDVCNKAYVDAAIAGTVPSGGMITVVSVADIAAPDLSAQAGTAGAVLYVYQAGAPDVATLYAADVSSPTANSPYVVAGSGCSWVAIGGRYTASAVSLLGALVGSSGSFSGTLSANALSATAGVSGASVTASGALQGASLNVTGANLTHSGVACVKAYKAAAQTIADATPTVLTGWTEIKDVGGRFDASAGTFTAQYAGEYLIQAKANFAANATGARALAAYVNGALLPECGTVGHDASLAQSHMMLSTTLTLAANDVVTIVVNQTSGGDLDIIVSPDGNRPWVNIIKLA